MKLSESDLSEPEPMDGVTEVMDLLVIKPKLTPVKLPDFVMFSSHSLQIVCQRALKSVILLRTCSRAIDQSGSLSYVSVISWGRSRTNFGSPAPARNWPTSSEK